MAIILRLDRVMADRKISLNELAERVFTFPCFHGTGHFRINIQAFSVPGFLPALFNRTHTANIVTIPSVTG